MKVLNVQPRFSQISIHSAQSMGWVLELEHKGVVCFIFWHLCFCLCMHDCMKLKNGFGCIRGARMCGKISNNL